MDQEKNDRKKDDREIPGLSGYIPCLWRGHVVIRAPVTKKILRPTRVSILKYQIRTDKDMIADKKKSLWIGSTLDNQEAGKTLDQYMEAIVQCWNS